MGILLVVIIVLLGCGLKLIRFDLKALEEENIELQKSNKEMFQANDELIKKIKQNNTNINQAISHNPENYGKF